MSTRINRKVIFGVILLGGLWITLKTVKDQRGLPSENLAKSSVLGSDQRSVAAAVSETKAAQSGGLTNTSQSIPLAVTLPKPEVFRDYKNIHLKTFKTPQEEARQKEILSDYDYIKNLSLYLRSTGAMKNADFKINQDTAIDLLLESLKIGDAVAARSAILEIARDNQVENQNLELEIRETLAGVKGELIYHATALYPNSFTEIPDLLPGPVSRKIWENVKEKQRLNHSESVTESRALTAAGQ